MDRSVLLQQFEAPTGWREKANAGIELYRKGDAHVRVVDRENRPVPHARLHIEQKTHAFRFGANCFMLDELETPEKNEAYKARFAALFNLATLPFYWDANEPSPGQTRFAKDSPRLYRRPAPDLCLEFCRAHGIEPREHGLAYPAFFPRWIKGADRPTVKRALERRMAEIAARYADQIPTIEVTNEMDWPSVGLDFYNDPDFVLWCFQTAEKYFPKNKLAINEVTPHAWGDRCRATDLYYAYTQANLLRGARIDAVGMQYHLFFPEETFAKDSRPYLSPENLSAHLDLYANLQKPLQITEVTVPAFTDRPDDEELQASLLENLYTLWFSHPAVEQIVYWNLIDGYAHLWDPDPAKIRASQGDMTRGENIYRGGLLRFDGSPKPAYHTLDRLIHRTWHTSLEGATDEAGLLPLRGFYGEYEITTSLGDSSQTRRFTLSPTPQTEFRIVL